MTMLLMTVGLCHSFTGLTMNYLRYPVNVAISIVQQQQLVFPAVTICNLNPVRKSALIAAIGKVLGKDKPLTVGKKRRRKKRITGFCGPWQCFHGFYYCIYSDPLSETDASYACKGVSSSSNVLSINDMNEYIFVQQLINNTFKDDSWLGANRNSLSGTDKSFTYTDKTSSTAAQTWWDVDEPNGSGYCVRTTYLAGNKLRDTDCSVPYRFICKRASTDASCQLTTPKPITKRRARAAASTLSSRIMTTAAVRTTRGYNARASSYLPTGGLSMTIPTIAPSGMSTKVTTEVPRELSSVSTEIPLDTSTEIPVDISAAISSEVPTEMVTLVSTQMPKEISTRKATEVRTEIPPKLTTEACTNSLTRSTEKGPTETQAFATTAVPTEMPTTKGPSEMLTSLPKEVHSEAWNSKQDTTAEKSTTTTTTVSVISLSTFVIGTNSSIIRCCCQCCSTVDGKETCNTCSNDTLENSALCSTSENPQAPSGPHPSPAPTTTTNPPPVTNPPFKAPRPMNGSRFPERTAKTEMFLAGELFLERMTTLTVKEKMDFGYSLESMILECKYANTECLKSDFESFYNPHHGNCYVFNSGWNKSKSLRMATRTGHNTGLKMLVNIGQRDYIQNIGDTSGLRVIVHRQGSLPFPEDEGITISPGYFSSIAIKKSVVFLQPHPYGNCSMHIRNDPQTNFYTVTNPVTYSRQACEKTCYQKQVMKECLCMDPSLPSGAADDKATLRACSSRNITQDDCRYAITKKFASNDLPCDCPDLCRSTSYIHHTSLRAWPSEINKKATLARLSSKLGPDFDVSDEKMVADNLVKFELYFEKLSYKLFQERPTYPAISYLSDLGGILGLWFGFAMFAFFEFVEFAADVIVLAVGKLSTKKKPE